MSSWKSTSTSKLPCVAGDGLYLDEFSNVKDLQSRQHSGTRSPSSSVGAMESNGVVGNHWHAEQAKISLHKVRASTPPYSIHQSTSCPPVSQTWKKIIPTIDADDLDLPLDKDQWFPEGHASEMMIHQRGQSVERGMLFPWMTDSEIV